MGEKEGVHTVYATYLIANIHIFFFHPNCWFLFIQIYPFLLNRKIKNSLNLDGNYHEFILKW